MGSETNDCACTKPATGVCECLRRATPTPTADGEADFAVADKHASELLAAFGDHPRLTPGLSPVSAVIHAYLAIRAAHHSADASKTLPADVQALVELLRELVAGEDACRYDHHGYCQSHRLDPKPCPVERATALLAHIQRTEG